MTSNHRKPAIHIAWTTITYRSLALLVLAFAVAFMSMRLVFPQFTQNTLEKASDVASRVLEKVAGMAPATGTTVSARRAHFMVLHGKVRVKKGNGATWVRADYPAAGPLGKGEFSGCAVAFGEGERDRPAAHAHRSRESAVAVLQWCTHQGCRVLLHTDDECSWLPPSQLPQSVFFLYTRGQKGEYSCGGGNESGRGVYYWMVQSYDAEGKGSVESEKNCCNIISTGTAAEAIDLELDPFFQHGHLIEVIGKEHKGARA